MARFVFRNFCVRRIYCKKIDRVSQVAAMSAHIGHIVAVVGRKRRVAVETDFVSQGFVVEMHMGLGDKSVVGDTMVVVDTIDVTLDWGRSAGSIVDSVAEVYADLVHQILYSDQLVVDCRRSDCRSPMDCI